MRYKQLIIFIGVFVSLIGAVILITNPVKAGVNCCVNDDGCSSWESCVAGAGCASYEPGRVCSGDQPREEPTPIPPPPPPTRVPPTQPPRPTDPPNNPTEPPGGGGGGPPPQPSEPAGGPTEDPGGGPPGCGNPDCTTVALGYGVGGCPANQVRLRRTCSWSNCGSNTDEYCSGEMTHAPVWVRVLSNEPGIGTVSWKGSQANDPVKGSRWSISAPTPDVGFSQYRSFAANNDGSRPSTPKNFDTLRNRIDTSGTMDVWIEDDYGNSEYWSNHYCAGGFADRDSSSERIAGAVRNCNGNTVTTFCDLAPGSCDTGNPYCAADFDGCIDDLAGNNSCPSGSLGCRPLGYHDSLRRLLQNQGQPYDQRWSATFWTIRRIGNYNQFNIELWLRPPSGYNCISGGARRTDGDSDTGPAEDFDWGGVRPDGRCEMEFEVHGNGILATFNIQRNPQIPNCSNVTASRTSINLGETITLTADYESLQGNLSAHLIAGNPNQPLTWATTIGNETPATIGNVNNYSMSKTWTPTQGGTYQIGCIANNGSSSTSCGAQGMIGGPGMTCLGPTTTTTVTVNTPQPWYKLKNASFHKKSNLTAFVPPTSNAYDISDTADGLFISGNAGVVSAQGTTTITTPSGKLSSSNLRVTTNHTETDIYNTSTFLNYALQNKKVKQITNLNQIVSGTDEIHYLNLNGTGWLETHATAGNRLPNGNYVLIVNGNIRFRDNAYSVGNPASNIAIMSTGQIQIHSSYSEINALLIGNSVDLSYPGISTTALKIRGNLISASSIGNIERQRTDSTRPSLYIVFDPSVYLNLLPLLSTRESQGRTLR